MIDLSKYGRKHKLTIGNSHTKSKLKPQSIVFNGPLGNTVISFLLLEVQMVKFILSQEIQMIIGLISLSSDIMEA
jgi:hypothetical protein